MISAVFVFLDRFLGKIESFKSNIFYWVFFFLGVVFFRYLLEGLAGLGVGKGFLPSFAFIHYFLWYGVVFLVAAFIIHVFSRKPISFILRLIVVFSPFILFPVIFPFIIGEPVNLSAHYVYLSDPLLLIKTIGNFFVDHGFSVSLRLQIATSLLALGAFVYWITKKWTRSLAAMLISYVLLILIGSLPSFVIFFQNPEGFYPTPFFLDLFYNHSQEILIGRGYFTQLSNNTFNFWFDSVLSAILFPLMILTVLLATFAHRKDFLKTIVKNCRLRKGFDFAVSIFLGMAAGFFFFGGIPPLNFLNIVALINVLLVGFLFYGATAFYDDVYDSKIDVISHPQRPIVAGAINQVNSLKISLGLAILSLLGALIISLHLFVFVLASLFLVFVYSSPPLRLKRFFLINTSLVALAFLFFVLGGFFTAFPQKTPADFPAAFAWLFFLTMVILVSLKDISDYEGDRAGGIKTLPVVLGPNNFNSLIFSRRLLFFEYLGYRLWSGAILSD